MSLRMPQTPPSQSRGDAAMSELAAELAGEQAAALGRTGRAVERALAALKSAGPDDAARPQLLKAAAAAVWGYFVQREVSGIRDHAPAIADYAIPREVLARLGARD
jgi:hypothetical protein